MRKRWIAVTLATICAFSSNSFAFAANLQLKEGSTTAAATIYDYQPLIFDAAGRARYGNTIYCSAQERLYGNDGKIYRLADASPLSDSSQFRSKIQLLTNAPAVKTLKLAKDEQKNQNFTSFVITLADDWLYQDVLIKFQVTYTALKDTSLSVLPTGASSASPMEMKVGDKEKIVVEYTVNIADDALFTGNYDDYELRSARYEQTILPTDPLFPSGPEEVILSPEKDEDADLTWDDVGKLVAQVNFNSGSLDSSPKLSTLWKDTYLTRTRSFGDCYARIFVGNPQTQSGQVTLILTNPFLTEEGEETIPHEDVVIYELQDGYPVEITRQATYGTDSDGNGAFLLSTDHLGSYILASQKLS